MNESGVALENTKISLVLGFKCVVSALSLSVSLSEIKSEQDKFGAFQCCCSSSSTSAVYQYNNILSQSHSLFLSLCQMVDSTLNISAAQMISVVCVHVIAKGCN